MTTFRKRALLTKTSRAPRTPRSARWAIRVTGRHVIMSRAYYEAMIERIEDLEDANILREAAENRDPRKYLPIDLVERMLAGEHPVRVWRERRGFLLAYLAANTGLSENSIQKIETGRKVGSIAALKALATALDLTVDDLIP